MNWDAIGAIAELVGAVAVVVTLIYLAIQIRQSNTSARVAARLEMTRQYSDFADGLINNPEANRVLRSGLAEEQLNESDQLMFAALMHKCFWYFSAMHFQQAVHSFSDDEWYQSKRLIRRITSNPGARSWWEQNKSEYSPSFVDFLESDILNYNNK